MLWPGGIRGTGGIRGRQSPLVPARCRLRERTQRWDLWLRCQCWSCVCPVVAARGECLGSCPVSPEPVVAGVGTCHLCCASASAESLGVRWGLGHRGAAVSPRWPRGSPRAAQRHTNSPPDSFITPWGQSVWEMGRPLAPADGGLNHRRLCLDFSTTDSQQRPFQAVLGMGLFCSPGTAGAVPAVWPQRSSQHVTEEHVVKLGDFIILRI